MLVVAHQQRASNRSELDSVARRPERHSMPFLWETETIVSDRAGVCNRRPESLRAVLPEGVNKGRWLQLLELTGPNHVTQRATRHSPALVEALSAALPPLGLRGMPNDRRRTVIPPTTRGRLQREAIVRSMLLR